MKPHLGQVPENSSKSPASEHWGVLHADFSWSYLTNDARHFSPEAGVVAVDSVSPSGAGDVLARKASRYDFSNSSPRSSVKQADVIPYRERREASIVLSCNQDGLGVRLDFDCADWSIASQQSGKYSSTSARE
jgi:hypothetical protein